MKTVRKFRVDDRSRFGFHARNAAELIKLIKELKVNVHIETNKGKHSIEMFSLMYMEEKSYEVVIESDSSHIYEMIYDFFDKEFL